MRRITRNVLATALLAITCTAGAATVTPIDERLVSVQVATQAESREMALRNAEKEAVIAAAGRVLLDDQLFRAENLLKLYLENNYKKFVLGTEIVVDQFRGGANHIDARVFVDYAALAKDLDNKRFLYTPAFRPSFAVFIDETLDRERLDQQVAQPLLANALLNQGLKPTQSEMPSSLTRLDVLTSDQTRTDAIEACERRGIELFISGTARTTLREQRKVYYDTFFFYDSEITVKAIRVDTGEELASTTARGSGSDRSRAEAARLAIERASDSVAADLAEKYRDIWPAVRGAEDFEILLTGSTDESIRVISEYMRTLGSGTQVTVRRSFDRSAILSVRTDADRASVLEALKACPYPSLTVVKDDGKRKFEVQVSS